MLLIIDRLEDSWDRNDGPKRCLEQSIVNVNVLMQQLSYFGGSVDERVKFTVGGLIGPLARGLAFRNRGR